MLNIPRLTNQSGRNTHFAGVCLQLNIAYCVLSIDCFKTLNLK